MNMPITNKSDPIHQQFSVHGLKDVKRYIVDCIGGLIQYKLYNYKKKRKRITCLTSCEWSWR
jgi:hypothetical protein